MIPGYEVAMAGSPPEFPVLPGGHCHVHVPLAQTAEKSTGKYVAYTGSSHTLHKFGGPSQTYDDLPSAFLYAFHKVYSGEMPEAVIIAYPPGFDGNPESTKRIIAFKANKGGEPEVDTNGIDINLAATIAEIQPIFQSMADIMKKRPAPSKK
jgi:hypothetical protein